MAPPKITTPIRYRRGSTSATDPAKIAANVTRELNKLERAQPNMRTVQVTEDYTVDVGDRTILVDSGGGNVNVQLRAAVLPLMLPIAIIKVSVDANDVVVKTVGADLIGGSLGFGATIVISEPGIGYSFFPDGIDTWWILGQPSWGDVSGTPESVTALAALTGVADTVPYFTSVSAMALASLTPYARTILACANASSARTVLGLGGLAVLSAVTESEITLADVATGNVSTAKHGFAPKLPNDATRYLDGTGNYTVPAGGGSSAGAYPFDSTTGLMFRWNASLAQTDLSSKGYGIKIYDISGNARHGDTNNTNPPKFLHRGFLNGFPALWFHGSARLTISAMPGLAAPLACTIIFIGQDFVKTASGNCHIYNWAGNPIGFGGGNTPLAFMYDGTLPAEHPMSLDENSNLPTGLSGYPALAIHVYNGAASVQSINNNEQTVNPGTLATGATNFFTIGSDSASSPGSWVKMILHEIAVLNFAASAVQRASLYTYYKTLLGMKLP